MLAAVSAFAMVPSGAVYAAEPGKIGSVTARVAKDSDGNPILYNGDATFEGRHVGGKGKEKYRLFVDGYSTFCIEPGASLHNGSELKQSSSDVWDALSADKKQAIGLTLLYGSQGNRDILPGSKDEGWLGTQIIIWEYIMGCRETSGSFKRLNTTACDVFFGENYPNKGVEKAYNYVADLLARHNTIPSFMSKEKNKVVKELTLTDGKRSITLTDDNKMLAEYDFSTSDKNVTVSKNGNTLTITAAKDFDGKVLITASRNNLPSGDNTCRLMAYGDTTLQDVIVGADDMDTVVAYMSVEAPSGGLALKKVSDDGVVEGVTFTIKGNGIYNPSGKCISMKLTYPEVKTIDTFYTSSDGTLTTPQSLEYGKGYKLVEVQAPYGYVLDSTPISFDVTKENAQEIDKIPVIKVTRSNAPQKGTITVTKNGEVFSSVSEAKGIYQPIYAVKGLSGAVFTITAAEDIVTPDGTTRVKKGTLVDTITTDAKGSAKSKQLYLGKYEVKEITAPTGFVLSGKVKTVELTYAGQDVKVTSTATEFTNLRQKVEIELKKGLEIDELYGIGTNGEIFDISFGLYAAEKLTAADGKTIPKDGLIEILFLSDEGRGKAKTDLPIGNYYVKEIAANSAYVVGNTKFPVKFAYAGQEKATVSIKVNDGNSIANKIIYGSVRGKKTDEDGNALGGAVIGIFKVGTEKYTEKTAIQTATSTEDGSFGFDKVLYGTWIVREIAAPTGFVLSEEEFPVTVGKAEQVIEISMVNSFIKGNLALTKVDADYPDNKLTGAEFEVFSDTDNDGELGENDLLLGLMAEGERGCYRMNELRYGRYFVREKTAPVGFVLDTKVYPVFISENGVTYFIQNKAGVGFINNAQKGSLKIQKRSTDKKVKGFSFRVTGDNGYDQVFKTDKNGEIFIEGLRIGEYRVSEVSDKVSAPYILPADETVDVKYNETATVEMLNKNRDTPKTGDDFNSALWIGGAVSALAGAAALLFFGLRKRKKAE